MLNIPYIFIFPKSKINHRKTFYLFFPQKIEPRTKPFLSILHLTLTSTRIPVLENQSAGETGPLKRICTHRWRKYDVLW